MYSNLKDAITDLHATDVCWIWTIIVPGSIIVLDSGTENNLCFYLYTCSSVHIFQQLFSQLICITDSKRNIGCFNRGEETPEGFFTLAIVIGAEVVSWAASFIMTNFLKFHIDLILNNKTTIEFLEKKGEAFESQYNISPIHNWQQVFGSDKLLWFFPVSFASGHPIGDGIIWPTNPAMKQNTGDNNPATSRQNQPGPRSSENSENHRLVWF